MYFADHATPHFHVEYQGHEALVAIADGRILEGSLPKRCAALVAEWAQERRQELTSNWGRGQSMEPLFRIPGADQ